MSKKITELTKEEIARMFPVELVAHQEKWMELFEEEKKRIAEALGNNLALRIEHFGSTAIPDLSAKDTIDILLEIPSDEALWKEIIAKMENISYEFMWQTDSVPPYMVFAKGYNTEGTKEQTYHIHAGPKGHALWDRLYFRDYLRQNPDIAKQYEALKLALAEKYRYDRVGYRIAKTEFVVKITEQAKALIKIDGIR